VSVPYLFQCLKDEALRPDRTTGIAEQWVSAPSGVNVSRAFFTNKDWLRLQSGGRP
jgi:hypothetical protein